MAEHDDDIDAEFRELVAGLGSDAKEVTGEDPTGDEAPDSSRTVDEGVRQMDLAALEASLKDPDDTPVDESLHLAEGKLSVALVLAPIPSPEALHTLLGLVGIAEAVVRLKPWTAVWLRVESAPTDEDELDALLAETQAMPDRVDQVARVVSRLSKYGAVAMMSWLVEGNGVEPGVSGRISAQRYVSGKPEDPIPAGLLLGSMPQAAEDLLLGRTTPGDYGDSVAADGGGKRRPGPLGWLRRR